MLKTSTVLKSLAQQRSSLLLLKSASLSAARFQSSEKAQELRPLYLDAQATTPIDPRVLDAMLPYMTNMYGNPHSRTHAYGWESEKAVELAREVSTQK